MGRDEEGTLDRMKALRRELIDPKLAEHNGRVFKTTGDGFRSFRANSESQSPPERCCCIASSRRSTSDALDESSRRLCKPHGDADKRAKDVFP
jgi:class 3 adenylate cyclase